MKYGHLEVYHAKLVTRSPVFIGSGDEICKKEYIYYPDAHQVVIPDINKLFSFLARKGLEEEYIQFSMKGKTDLLSFLRSNSISDSQIHDFTLYTINAGDAIIQKKSKKAIQMFIKDGHGMPYIPGSSIKGAIRNALLSYYLKKSPIKMEVINQLVSSSRTPEARKQDFLGKTVNNIEAGVFNKLNLNTKKVTDTVNDFMKGVSISDSNPASFSSIVLCTKIDLSVHGNAKPLNIYRECIKPDTSVQFTITIDTHVAEKAGYSLNDIQDALCYFNNEYRKCFSSRFQFPANCDIRNHPEGMPLYLGGGAGFATKTSVYPIMGFQKGIEFTSNILCSKFPPNHNHGKDIQTGVSPHMIKMTQYNGKLYQMGYCEIFL